MHFLASYFISIILCYKYFSDKVYFGKINLGMPSLFLVSNMFSHLTMLAILQYSTPDMFLVLTIIMVYSIAHFPFNPPTQNPLNM